MIDHKKLIHDMINANVSFDGGVDGMEACLAMAFEAAARAVEKYKVEDDTAYKLKQEIVTLLLNLKPKTSYSTVRAQMIEQMARAMCAETERNHGSIRAVHSLGFATVDEFIETAWPRYVPMAEIAADIAIAKARSYVDTEAMVYTGLREGTILDRVSKSLWEALGKP